VVIFWNKQRKWWQAQIYDKGKLLFLGHFATPNEQDLVYNAAVKRLGRPASWLKAISDDTILQNTTPTPLWGPGPP
jgi:hypothetical protein